MKKMSKGGGGGGGDSWLNTYADMVTLLLTFFVLLFTMSSVDAEKWQTLVAAFSTKGQTAEELIQAAEKGGQGTTDMTGNSDSDTGENAEASKSGLPTDFNELYEYIKKYVTDNNMEGSVTLQKGANSVYIRFADNVFFDPDKSNLRNESIPLLNFMGQCFNAVSDQIASIRINGHTATVPGTVKKPGFDRSLSSERANSVLLYFEETMQFDPKKLISIGYGRNYPVADNSTEEGRKKNRRVEIMIMSNNFNLSEESDLYKFMTGQIDANLFEDEQNSEDVILPSGGSSAKPSGSAEASPQASPAASPAVPTTTSQPIQTAAPEPSPASGKEIYEGISPFDD